MNIENTELENTTEQNPETQENDSQPTEQELLDLAAVEKFKFKDKEWTADELEKAMMMQSDYTRKTQALSEERKYYDNLSADLEAIKMNPSLAARFKEVYPEKFHGYLNYVLGQAGRGSESPAATKDQPNLPPEVLSRLEKVEQRFFETDVKNNEQWLDTQFAKFSSKFEHAREQDVVTMLQARLAEKTKEGTGKLTEKDVEEAFKVSHEAMESFAKAYVKKLNSKQMKANELGRDVPRGGGIPGQAPVVARNLKEATAAALAHYSGN